MSTHIQRTNLTQKELILILIKAEMRNVKLIYGLEQAGVLVEHFYADLSMVILNLMGFEEKDRTDALYDFYDQCMHALIDVSVGEFTNQLPFLAEAFYNELLMINSK